MIRIIAISQSKSLSLKRAFVRYVSHEIRFDSLTFGIAIQFGFILFRCRSPLNVVHAGLDILRSELSCLDTVGGLFGQMSDSTAELIEDIYTASETAIAILNDLLHYEHMDAGTKSVYILVDNIKVCTPGTFQLEQVKRPLNGLLEGKLHWASW